ncbi:MAG: hypothetical protein BWY85_01245 [Firmicutes bacterium ADurb.Bin506]|nr:MAG: hypothetical protein BWY85_01245 [Firmicutes bacterium ADurb.Bin506]
MVQQFCHEVMAGGMFGVDGKRPVEGIFGGLDHEEALQDASDLAGLGDGHRMPVVSVSVIRGILCALFARGLCLVEQRKLRGAVGGVASGFPPVRP